MIRKRTATTAMLEQRRAIASARRAERGRPAIVASRAVVRSNRVLITDRRDMPLVSPARNVKVSKRK